MKAPADVRASPGDGGTHGFLFADLRGYTHLVDTRGAVAASHLLGRYRAIVREVVTHHGGAEIKTEGDSFYVVLPSASEALRCGLDIVGACREPEDGGEAIVVGVGVHAGESVAHDGGFVGSAVNIAARICALAAAGELLVSGTVRELTRSIVSEQFESVGRRHLKGLAEPVELFRVNPHGAATSAAHRRREASGARPRLGWVAIAVFVIAGLAMGATIGLGWRPIAWLSSLGGSGSSAASSRPSASQLEGSPSIAIALLPTVGITVEPGTYAPRRFRDVSALTIPDCCWKAAADTEDLLFFGETTHEAGVGVAWITVVYTGGCPGDLTRTIGDRPQDLIDWVLSAPQFDASAPRAVIDLGRSGIGIEATVLAPPPGACDRSIPPQTYLWGISGGAWSPDAGDVIHFEALDYGPRTLTVVYAAVDADELAAFEAGSSRTLLASFVLR